MSAMRQLGHRPELDGLRGLAVLFVMLAHAGVPGFSLGGAVGVEVFFVLSGFLITTLLLEADRVDLRRFYARRARRLLPALGALLLTIGIAAAAIGDEATLAGVGAGVTYVSNIARAGSIDLGVLNHLWSLAVEEHFYLLWPLVVIACRGRDRMVGAVAFLGLVGGSLWRLLLGLEGATWDRIYNGTDTRIAGILAGCLLAVIVRAGLRLRVGLVGLMALGALLWWSDVVAAQPFRWGFLAIDLAAAAVIVGSISHPMRTLTVRPVVWLGDVSYAAYLWHVPIMSALGPIGDLAPVAVIGSMLLTGVASAASMRWVERRWRSQPTRASAFTVPGSRQRLTHQAA